MSKTKTLTLLLTTAFVSLTVLACSDDDDASGGGDVAGSCDSMCKGAGFTSSRVDQQPHETNCFCTGGAGTITADACTNMCKSVGKPGQPFGSGAGVTSANSCQCQ